MKDQKNAPRPTSQPDEVAEAGRESFPASDPPSNTGSVGPEAPPFDTEEVFDQEEVFHEEPAEKVPESDKNVVDPKEEAPESMEFPESDEEDFEEDEILDPEEEGFASSHRENSDGAGRVRMSLGDESEYGSEDVALDSSIEHDEEPLDVPEPAEEADS